MNMSNEPMTDPLEVLKSQPSGSAIFTIERIDGADPEIAWMISEDPKRIAQLGTSPEIEFRTGLIIKKNVGLIPVIVRVGDESPVSVYEAWINVHADGHGGLMRLLKQQPRLVVHVYENGPREFRLARTLTISNRLVDFADFILAAVGGGQLGEWSMSEFDAARDRLYEAYPTVFDLWKHLGEPRK